MPLGNFIWFQVPVWTFFVLTQKIMDTVDRTSRPVDFKQDEETSWLQPNCRFGEKATGIESCPRPVLPRPSFVNFRDCSPGYYVRWEMAHTKSWTTHQTHLRQKLHMWPGQARERPLKFNTFILCLFCTLETVHTNHWCCVKNIELQFILASFTAWALCNRNKNIDIAEDLVIIQKYKKWHIKAQTLWGRGDSGSRTRVIRTTAAEKYSLLLAAQYNVIIQQ